MRNILGLTDAMSQERREPGARELLQTRISFCLVREWAVDILTWACRGPTAFLALGLTWMHRESLPKAAHVNVFRLFYSYTQVYGDVTGAINIKR